MDQHWEVREQVQVQVQVLTCLRAHLAPQLLPMVRLVLRRTIDLYRLLRPMQRLLQCHAWGGRGQQSGAAREVGSVLQAPQALQR